MNWWVFCAVASLLVVPAAAAEMTATTVAPQERIRPETGMGRLQLNVTIDCQTAWLVGPPAVAGVIPVRATFAVAGGVEGVYIAGPQNVLLPNCASPAASTTDRTVEYTVTFSRQAPGLQPIGVQVHVEGPRAKAGLYPDQDAYANFTVEGDYFALVQATIAERVQEGAPGSWLRFPVNLTNVANADSIANLVLGAPLPEGWSVSLPEPIRLAQNGSASVAAVEILVNIPGDDAWNNRELPLEFETRSVAEADPTRNGTAQSVSLLARVRGFGGAGVAVESPGASPWVAVAVLAAAFVVSRRKFAA